MTDADLLIGTSAGSSVAAQLGSGLSLEALFARQVDPALQTREIASNVDLATLGASLASVLGGASSSEELRGVESAASALATKTVPEVARREVLASRLPSHEWPARRTRIVAVDATTGVHRIFDRTSGVPLVDAVAASCAVPGVWPPVTIGDARYMDGGVRSSDNADLASGFARIVIVSPARPRLGAPDAVLRCETSSRGFGRRGRRSWCSPRMRHRSRPSARTRSTRRPARRRRGQGARRENGEPSARSDADPAASIRLWAGAAERDR